MKGFTGFVILCCLAVSQNAPADEELEDSSNVGGKVVNKPIQTFETLQTDAKWPEVSPLLDFSSSFYKVAAKHKKPTENVFISPLSLAAALSMIHAGARGNTAQQIAKVLNLASTDGLNRWIGNLVRSTNSNGYYHYTLNAVNRMYVEYTFPLNPEFQTAMSQNFEFISAPPVNVDFIGESDDTRIDINHWVEQSSEKQFQGLLPDGSINDRTKMVLVNAIYFKRDWLQKFDPKLTKAEPFYLGSKDRKLNVNMMHKYNSAFHHGNIPKFDARILEIPYSDHKLNMFIVLPNQYDGIGKLEEGMSDLIRQIDDYTKTTSHMNVVIPKFKIGAGFLMRELLTKLGMSDMFSYRADFSAISRVNNLYVSQFFHNTIIEVNEDGSETTGSSGNTLYPTHNSGYNVPTFVADRPFLYFIRDNNTKTFLFIGRMTNPNKV